MKEVKGVVVTNEKYLHFFLRNDMFRQFSQSALYTYVTRYVTHLNRPNEECRINWRNDWMGIGCGTSVQDISCYCQ